MSGIRGLNHVTLAVRDVDRSVGFYRDLLGLHLKAQWKNGAYLEAGALWLCLSRDAECAPATDYTHIAFDVAAGDFDVLAAWVAAGADLWKENRSEGASLYIFDPDGHRLELHAGSLASRLKVWRADPDKADRVLTEARD